jgi:hypothetical protein
VRPKLQSSEVCASVHNRLHSTSFQPSLAISGAATHVCTLSEASPKFIGFRQTLTLLIAVWILVDNVPCVLDISLRGDIHVKNVPHILTSSTWGHSGRECSPYMRHMYMGVHSDREYPPYTRCTYTGGNSGIQIENAPHIHVVCIRR